MTPTFAQMVGFYLQREHATTAPPQNMAHARYTVGWLTIVFVALCFIVLMSTRVRGAADSGQQPTVTVTEVHGVYSVTTRFVVEQSPAIALAVLTDYKEIPGFMPGVETSVVLERGVGRREIRARGSR